MPITRKHQILSKLQTSEGVAAVPGSGDAKRWFEPAMSDEVEQQDRPPSGASLSREFSLIGRKTRQITGKSDFRGNNDITIPVTDPEWASDLLSCGYKRAVLKKVTLGAVTGTGFQVGEIASQASDTIRGVIIGAFTSGGAPVHRLTTSGGHLVVVPFLGTFTAVATAGNSSGSTATASAVADYEGAGFQPTSEKSNNVTVPSWTGSPPAAVGEVLSVEVSGVVVGSVQIIRENSSPGTFTDFDVTQLFGTIAATNTLRSAANGTATITATSMFRTPCQTIRSNLDGWQSDLVDARGDFTLEGEVGQPLQFTWTFSGNPVAGIAAAAITTTGLTAITPPRLLGAVCAYGKGVEIFRLPTKRVTFNNGGQVNPNLDANSAGGSTGSNVTDRSPSFQVSVDRVHSGFDWEAARESSTPVRVAMILGTAKGNVCVIVAPICQVTEVTASDNNGVATFDVTLAPRRIQESGDDELYLAQL